MQQVLGAIPGGAERQTRARRVPRHDQTDQLDTEQGARELVQVARRRLALLLLHSWLFSLARHLPEQESQVVHQQTARYREPTSL